MLPQTERISYSSASSFSPFRAKKELAEEEKYHAAVRPELVEGQARSTFAYVLTE